MDKARVRWAKGVEGGRQAYRAKVTRAGPQVDAGEDDGAAATFDPAPIFKPLDVGLATPPNRIVMAPMTRNMSPCGVPGADMATYYHRLAKGGVGLILTEGPGFSNLFPRRPSLRPDTSIPLCGTRPILERAFRPSQSRWALKE